MQKVSSIIGSEDFAWFVDAKISQTDNKSSLFIKVKYDIFVKILLKNYLNNLINIC